MLRNITAFILCAVLAFPWASKVAITADFLIHQDYIAQNLCENKDKPEMECNGKCVLMQKLQLKEDPSQEPLQLPHLTQLEISTFVVTDFDFAALIPTTVKSEKPLAKSEDRVDNLHSHDIFHPPRLS